MGLEDISRDIENVGREVEDTFRKLRKVPEGPLSKQDTAAIEGAMEQYTAYLDISTAKDEILRDVFPDDFGSGEEDSEFVKLFPDGEQRKNTPVLFRKFAGPIFDRVVGDRETDLDDKERAMDEAVSDFRRAAEGILAKGWVPEEIAGYWKEARRGKFEFSDRKVADIMLGVAALSVLKGDVEKAKEALRVRARYEGRNEIEGNGDLVRIIA